MSRGIEGLGIIFNEKLVPNGVYWLDAGWIDWWLCPVDRAKPGKGGVLHHGLEKSEKCLSGKDISGDYSHHLIVFHNGHG